MADDGLYIEELLRSWAADGAGFLTAAEARHYRDALMLWPSPHCALEYQRMFVRNHFRGMGRDFRRALRAAGAVPLLSIHGQEDQLVPLSAMAAAERWVDARHDLISLPGVGHLPHEEDPSCSHDGHHRWLTAPCDHSTAGHRNGS